MVMVIDALLDACIFDSRKFDHFHLKYFDWLAQVVSLRRQLNYCGTRSNHILRAWDGHKLTRNNVLCGNIDSKEDEFIVPPADEYNNVPDTYFFDILLFGEWIERAALLKSKSFVVISNLHIFRGIGFKNPILALHGSPYFGRGVFEIDREFLSHHHRLIKLEKETSEVIEEYNRMNLDGSNKTTRIECIDDDCNKECTFVDFGSHDKNEFGQVADLSPVLLDGIEEISEERLAAFTHIFFNRPTDSKMLFSPIEDSSAPYYRQQF
ncbi:hypothetical protein RB195_010232 [Necator americanus]|uniref:Protection of telomeres protein 1 ssDNA-binding domain-containing protein n=1 Tax=Necator americanus TaxID=51031 RepID=A0ABR1CXS5_NECAM